MNLSFSAANNRMDGYGYDAAGNLLNDGNYAYTYDAENRISQVSLPGSAFVASYVYDAQGRRARKTTTSGTLDFLYDAEGHKVAEIDPTGTFLRGEFFAAGRHFAVFAPEPGPTGATFFTHSDWPGTERARTDMTGAACETITSLPFGDGQTISDSCGDSARDVSPMHFTGKERDSESGLDNFGARYDSSSLGRFMSPDPIGGHTEDPQTLNRYAYVRNNPLNLTDQTGLDFYLQCTPKADANGKPIATGTCQQMQVGTDKNGNAQMAWVQGVTGDNGFTATQIGNDANGNLVDRTTGTGTYTADITGSGVQLSNNGGVTSATGVFLNKEVDLTGTNQIQSYDTVVRAGNLPGFLFTFTNSKLEADQTSAGFFSYGGTFKQAGEALMAAGFQYRRFGFDWGSNEYRSPGEPSGHFVVAPR